MTTASAPSYTPKRKCDSCGAAMSPYLPRKRNPETNALLCPGCVGHNTAFTTSAAHSDLGLRSHDYDADVKENRNHFLGLCLECDAHYLAAMTRDQAESWYKQGKISQDQWEGFTWAWSTGAVRFGNWGDAPAPSSPQARAFGERVKEVAGERRTAFLDHRVLAARLFEAQVSMERVAHDSGDGETIYHCPFCGAGQVTGGQDGTVSCGFCNTNFTVQVQPEYAAMPQTVDGAPYDMPGMPMDKTGPGGTEPEPSPFEPEGGPGQPGDPAPGTAEEPKNPVPPQFRRGSLYVTEGGVALSEDAFVQHLAIQHADDRDAVLAQVRTANTEEARRG